tara:strand:- start:1050 stop:1286 length:237 start_codon:yes stop_codon:yes gene_type:complete
LYTKKQGDISITLLLILRVTQANAFSPALSLIKYFIQSFFIISSSVLEPNVGGGGGLPSALGSTLHEREVEVEEVRDS